MNINDDMPCFGGVPIDIRVSRGRLRCVPPYSDNELEFSSVEGRFIGISKVKWHRFPYWQLALQDEANTYHLLFFLKSGMFVNVVRCLTGHKVSHLSIMVGVLTDGSYQLIVEGDGKRLVPANITLPPVKHHYKKVDGKVEDWKDYKARLEAVQALVDEIGQPTHTHEGEGC